MKRKIGMERRSVSCSDGKASRGEGEDGIAFSRTDPSTDEVKGRTERWRDCPSVSMQCSIAIAM